MDFKKIKRWHRLLRFMRGIRNKRKKASDWMYQHMGWLFTFLAWLKRHLGWMNLRRYIKRMDSYLIRKFIGTYVYSIVLIISISIVFDVNENLAKFTTNHAPLKAIIFDYYANLSLIHI